MPRGPRAPLLVRCLAVALIAACAARPAPPPVSKAPIKGDDEPAAAGESCISPEAGDDYTCSPDHLTQLICASGRWTVLSTCKGPGGCVVRGNIVRCDDTLADVGDTCHPTEGEANYSCTPDGRTLVACRSGKFVLFEPCDGPLGCHIDHDLARCDIRSAGERGSCRSPGEYACSHDGASLLQCSPDQVWVKRKDCAPPGCQAPSSTELFCK